MSLDLQVSWLTEHDANGHPTTAFGPTTLNILDDPVRGSNDFQLHFLMEAYVPIELDKPSEAVGVVCHFSNMYAFYFLVFEW